MDNEKIYSSKKELLNFFEIKENYLYANFSNKYRKKDIPKKKGGVRTIKPPNFNLKNIQRKILDEILYKIPQLDCVYGLSKNKGIYHNAKLHKKNKNKELLNLDIEKFFPSIPNKDIVKIFIKFGFNKENSLILTKLCTVDKSLPQGAPTSPYLASMFCFKLDKKIFNYCKKRNLIYTRYFDDISISGEKILLKHENYFIKIIKSSRFNLNKDKREFFNCDQDKIINNVLITKLGLSVSGHYKKEIKNAYYRKVKNNTLSNQRIFAGKFGFYLHINKREAKLFLKEIKGINL